VPVAAIGYSRGGRRVVDYASIADVTGVVPSRIFSVFPSGTMDTPLGAPPSRRSGRVPTDSSRRS
jgi:hypothetical protein